MGLQVLHCCTTTSSWWWCIQTSYSLGCNLRCSVSYQTRRHMFAVQSIPTLSPTKWFSNVDFPALGRPVTAAWRTLWALGSGMPGVDVAVCSVFVAREDAEESTLRVHDASQTEWLFLPGVNRPSLARDKG